MRLSLLFVIACNTITSDNPNAPTEAEKLTFWTKREAPHNDWFAIHGYTEQYTFIVGKAGRILRWDAKELTELTSPTQEHLFAIYMCTAARGFAVGAHGTIIQWNGLEWKTDVSGIDKELRGVWCDDNNALAVGAEGTALQRSPMGWAKVMTDRPDDLFAIARSGGNPFAVGSAGTIATFNGTGFTSQNLSGFPKTLVAATAGPGGTFIGGVDGAVFNRGAGNQRIMGIPSTFVRGIAAPGGNNGIYVVGWDGLLARVNGNTVLPYKDAGETWLYGVYAFGPTGVWAVGADGVILSGPPEVDPAP